MRLKTILATAIAVFALSEPALASPPSNGGTTDIAQPATVTMVHGIPKVAVNIFANNKVILQNFAFGKSYTGPLAEGTYKFDVRPVGASATSTPILSKSVTLTPGLRVTISANLTSLGRPVMNVIANPLTDPAQGNARIIVRHMAQAPGVDIYTGQTTSAPLISNLKNGTGTGAEVPAGTYTIAAYVHGTTRAPVLRPLSLTLVAGKTYIVYVIGSAVSNPSSLTIVTQNYQNVIASIPVS